MFVDVILPQIRLMRFVRNTRHKTCEINGIFAWYLFAVARACKTVSQNTVQIEFHKVRKKINYTCNK